MSTMFMTGPCNCFELFYVEMFYFFNNWKICFFNNLAMSMIFHCLEFDLLQINLRN